jgi:hypothetical protein
MRHPGFPVATTSGIGDAEAKLSTLRSRTARAMAGRSIE